MIRRYFPPVCALLFFVGLANAQSQFDLNLGFGAAQAKAANTGVYIDPTTFLVQNCTTGSSGCTASPSLSAFMMGFGGDLLLWKKFGVGANITIEPSKQNWVSTTVPYGTSTANIQFQSRVSFYDFDAIYQPIKTKRASVQVFGGIGGASVKFYQNSSVSDALVGNSSSSQYYGSSNHFAGNFGVGVQLFLTDHIYVKPEFDLHVVNNFAQFGSNLATQEMVWVGYSWGGQ